MVVEPQKPGGMIRGLNRISTGQSKAPAPDQRMETHRQTSSRRKGALDPLVRNSHRNLASSDFRATREPNAPHQQLRDYERASPNLATARNLLPVLRDGGAQSPDAAVRRYAQKTQSSLRQKRVSAQSIKIERLRAEKPKNCATLPARFLTEV